MKVLQGIIVLFAIIGCLAMALGGFYVYRVANQGGLKISNPLKKKISAASAESTAPLTSTNPETAAILQSYQKTPIPVAAVQGAPGAAGAAIPGAVASASTPRPIATPDGTKKIIRDWPSGRKWVALTFDDGPHPEWTPKTIELLKSKNVKATFFLIGPEVEKHPDIARQLHESGFELANHTMTHPQMNKSSFTPEKITEELSQTTELIKTHSGQQQVTLMRPPYGIAPKKVQDVCDALGLKIITWNIDTDDWRSSTNADKMTSNVMSNLKDGSIILMHDRSEKAYETTSRIIDPIRAQGYEFVTVSELLGYGFTPGTAAVADTGTPPTATAAAPAPQATPPPAVESAPELALPAPATAVERSKLTTIPPKR